MTSQTSRHGTASSAFGPITCLYKSVGAKNACGRVSNASTSPSSVVRHQCGDPVTYQIATPVDATTNEADSAWWLKITENTSSEHNQRNLKRKRGHGRAHDR